MFEFVGIFAETCEKIDVCSRRKSNGEVISLRDVAGGAIDLCESTIVTFKPFPFFKVQTAKIDSEMPV